MRSARVAFALFASIAIHAAGCGADPDDPVYEYDEADMQGAVVGTHRGSLLVEGRPDAALTLTIEPAAPAAQPLCGSRTFARPACVDMSSLGLIATLATADGAFTDQRLEGSFSVYGLRFTSGELTLSGGGITLSGVYDEGLEEAYLSGDTDGHVIFER